MKTVRLFAITALTMVLAVASFAQERTPNLDKRERRQSARINEGVKSGELTNKEAARLRAREAKLHADEAKAKADGKVTPRERAKLQHEANRTSRHIYKQKHDKQKK